ncbi:MAG: hypothetical protein ACE5HD_13085 [Acidobacteriota bacterium]
MLWKRIFRFLRRHPLATALAIAEGEIAARLKTLEGSLIMAGKADEVADLAVDYVRQKLGIPDDDSGFDS